MMPQAMPGHILFVSINGSLPKRCERLGCQKAGKAGSVWIVFCVLFGCKQSVNKGLDDYELVQLFWLQQIVDK
jgi:hypothetical protein